MQLCLAVTISCVISYDGTGDGDDREVVRVILKETRIPGIEGQVLEEVNDGG